VSRKVSKRKSVKVLVISFSGALQPSSAQSLGNYHLVAPGKNKKSGAAHGKVVPLGSAAYDPVVRTVTLIPQGSVPKQKLQLTITAVGLLDAQGRPVNNDQNFVAVVGM
jgi:hypothetical protein